MAIDITARLVYNKVMGIISKIEKAYRKKDYAVIYIDGVKSCFLQTFTVLSENLKEGMDINEDRLADIQIKSDGETAFNQALKYIAIRMRSLSELEKYLINKGYLPKVRDMVISKLKKYNYINDNLFATQYVNSAMKSKGVKVIKMQLKKFGIESDLAESKLDSVVGQEEVATRLAKKYLKRRAFDRQKLATHLMGKGFEWEVVSWVISRLQGRQEEEGDD